MDWHAFQKPRLLSGVGWAILACAVIVAAAAALGRAALNLSAALTEKPDIAIYMLLPDEGIRSATLLRESDSRRDYLAETRDGPKMIILRKVGKKWKVAAMERLRE